MLMLLAATVVHVHPRLMLLLESPPGFFAGWGRAAKQLWILSCPVMTQPVVVP